MIQTYEKSRGKTLVYPEYYGPIREEIMKARAQFSVWADTIPHPIGEVVKAMSRAHEDGSLPDNLLGERRAFWLGELLGVGKEVQIAAAVGCIAGYTYAVHQDHHLAHWGQKVYIDRDKSQVGYGEFAKNFLFAKAIEMLQKVAQNENRFWEYFNRYLGEYASACIWDAQKGARPQQYSVEDLRIVARRSAPAKIVAASYALATGRERDIPAFEAASDAMATGLQIRDDLANICEDVSSGRYTYVISKLLGYQQPTQTTLQRAAIYTDRIENLLDESTLWLRRASETLGLKREATLQLYIDYMTHENTRIKAQVQEAKKTASFPSQVPQNLESSLGKTETIIWGEINDAIRTRLES